MKKIAALILLVPTMLHAAEQYEVVPQLTEAQRNEIKAQDEALGLITADSGLQVVPASKVALIPGKDEQRQKFLNEQYEMKKNGYVKGSSTEIQSMLAMRYPEYLTKKGLKDKLSDVKLAFSYPGLYFIPENNVIGYTGFIGWDNGWLGISQYFTTNDFAVCNYTRQNMKLSHGGVRLIAEDVEYIINNKPSNHIVKGNDAAGYLYYTAWYDQTYIHNLECVTERFKEDGVENLIHLAIEIDNVK